MESTPQLALEAKPQQSDMIAVVKNLGEFNRALTGGATSEHLFVSVRGEDGALLGGLLGSTYLGWLQVHTLWLPENLRSRDYGTELMSIAEAEALRRGCTRAYLETFSFQALPFYKKCGYTVFSRLADFPPGGARYALTKNLAAPA